MRKLDSARFVAWCAICGCVLFAIEGNQPLSLVKAIIACGVGILAFALWHWGIISDGRVFVCIATLGLVQIYDLARNYRLAVSIPPGSEVSGVPAHVLLSVAFLATQVAPRQQPLSRFGKQILMLTIALSSAFAICAFVGAAIIASYYPIQMADVLKQLVQILTELNILVAVGMFMFDFAVVDTGSSRGPMLPAGHQ